MLLAKERILGLPASGLRILLGFSYLWLVGNGRMVVTVVIIVPHSSIPY